MLTSVKIAHCMCVSSSKACGLQFIVYAIRAELAQRTLKQQLRDAPLFAVKRNAEQTRDEHDGAGD